MFVHGSIMADRINPKSDVDFTVIGELDNIPSELRDTLMPGLTAARALRTIDYASTSVRSQYGRKISMHISAPDFRDTHPNINKPYATEYRPDTHAKTGPRNYFLSGTDRNGNIRLINFLSESHAIESGGTVTDIPQTGILTLKGDTIFVNGSKKTDITAQDVIRLTPDGMPDKNVPTNITEEVMILGLEFDKLSSDTPIYRDPAAEQRFVEQPAVRSMNAIGNYTQTDPAVITNRLFGELARHWSKIKPHKAR